MTALKAFKYRSFLYALGFLSLYAVCVFIVYSKTGKHDFLESLEKYNDQEDHNVTDQLDMRGCEKKMTLPSTFFGGPHPDFQAVNDLYSILYVHAALWQADNVRITIVKKLNVPANDTLCLLWYSSDQNARPYCVKPIVRDLPSFLMKNACGYIKCPAAERQGEKNKIPVLVSLVDGKNMKTGLKITLPVENTLPENRLGKRSEVTKAGSTNKEGSRVVDFTLCVPTMFNFGNAGMLVEKLEMIKLMGAGRVVLYKTSIQPNVEAVLRMYARELAAGQETLEVIVHSWQLPSIPQHYYGQMAAVDDCLYRYKWSSRYMVFDDLDEFIVPIHYSNWSQMIAERERLNPDAAAFMFRTTVMSKDHSTPAKGFEADASQYYSQILRVMERDDYIYPPMEKSKLIVNPRKVESLSVHHVNEGYGVTDVVPPDEGLVYHYRWPNEPSCRKIKDTRVVDKYGERLLLGLKTAWSKLNKVPSGWKIPRGKVPACRNRPTST